MCRNVRVRHETFTTYSVCRLNSSEFHDEVTKQIQQSETHDRQLLHNALYFGQTANDMPRISRMGPHASMNTECNDATLSEEIVRRKRGCASVQSVHHEAPHLPQIAAALNTHTHTSWCFQGNLGIALHLRSQPCWRYRQQHADCTI